MFLQAPRPALLNSVALLSCQPQLDTLTVGMEHLTGESHLRRAQGVVKWETQDGGKNTKLKASVFRAPANQERDTFAMLAPTQTQERDTIMA